MYYLTELDLRIKLHRADLLVPARPQAELFLGSAMCHVLRW